LKRTLLLFAVLAALLAVSRLCHSAILWEGDTLPLAAAEQMARGKIIYRDVWYDKPVLVPAVHVLFGARPGWMLRLGDAVYALVACWLAWRFARDLWSEREGFFAAALLGFFLIFDLPSAAIPVASDLMLLAPHLAAVWMASQKKPFWSGVWVGIGFCVSPKALFVGAVCALWNLAGVPWLAAGFAASAGAVAAVLWGFGALGAFWEQVWVWGRLYASSPFVESPIRNGVVRTLNWAGFHAAAVIAAGRFAWRAAWIWIAWVGLALLGVATGLRFFPRYYFLLLPPLVLMAARGFALLGRRREFVALLLLIPATRFGPSYVAAIRDPEWRDTAMDRESRAASAAIRGMAQPGDTLFVWGYRPEMFAYTDLSAGTRYLDSQPLTGVPADRHLTQSEPVETEAAARRRGELAKTNPTFVVDGIGLLNPRLALTNYPDLREWLGRYREVARTSQTIIYSSRSAPIGSIRDALRAGK